MKKYPLFALTALMSSILTACGGSNSNDKDPTPTSISGQVADGYLTGAKVCLDKNNNAVCDANEPSAITGENGSYTLANITAGDENQYPIVVEVPATAIDSDTNAAVGQAYTLSAPAGKDEFISPLSTMVHNQMEAEGQDLSTAETHIKQSLGLDVGAFDNYMEQSSNESYVKAHKASRSFVKSMQANLKALDESVPNRATQRVVATMAHKAVAAQNAANNIDPTQIVGREDVATLKAAIALQNANESEATQAVTVTFDLVNGTTPVRCGQTISIDNVVYNHDAAPFTSTGTAQSTSGKLVDTRFYISNVMLVDAEGNKTPLYLDKTADTYQGDGVALLSFGQADGSCATTIGSGADAQKMTLIGKAKPGSYTGLVATLGVPVYAADMKTKLNHINPTPGNASGPLFDQPSMQWSWQLGRKFTKIEFQTDIYNFSKTTTSSSKWNFHLGSTGCFGDPTVEGNETTCTHPNRVPLSFENFKYDTQKIALDLGELFANSDLQFEGGMSAGCMSSHKASEKLPTDPECPAVFEKLGLDLATGEATASQVIFKVLDK